MGGDEPSRFDLEQLRRNAPVAHVEYRDSVDSTNNLAIELAKQSLDAEGPLIALPALVLAAQQTAGRGRGANRWWSAPGSLTFSLVIEPPADFAREHWSKLSLVTAVALCKLLERLVPEQTCGIRWPNDVYVGQPAERKIAGILVEVPALPNGASPYVVIGLGMNVNNSLRAAPDEVRNRATSLADLAYRDWNLTDVLTGLLRQIDAEIARLVRDDRDLPRDWQARCLLRGRQVALALGPRNGFGRVVKVDDDGALVLDTAAGRQRFFGGALTVFE